ncbi:MULTISPECIES: hypothetical protein [unclassified Acinetobacter]|uniref:hypothetical protein n=1 Tax=unclassified Acinetobacter TaxID=196816 RepID=UPI00190932E4|nr:MULTISPECIES: hypothetical protein [unclassified Acinetobacter]MBK0062374.1 hypothetical protein [Acinetobacter sp. S55]MBK0066178.1 hypothetical protein [Acinetobacter sp. S54]
MTLEQTTELYASVLRQLLPVGGYDRAPGSTIDKDIYAHAKAFAQADFDAKRLLQVINSIPVELINEYENALGLPLKCTTNVNRTIEERLEIINWIRHTTNVLNRTYVAQLLQIFGIELVELVNFKPFKCTDPSDSPVNTEVLRYKVKLVVRTPLNADMACIIKNYLPAFLRIDVVEI